MIGDSRLSVRASHCPEQRHSRGVVANVIERFDLRVPFHVGLPGEDEDFQRRGGQLLRRRQGPVAVTVSLVLLCRLASGCRSRVAVLVPPGCWLVLFVLK